MRIPKTIDVCGIEHRVVFIGEERMAQESGYAAADGCVDRDKNIIYLANALKKNPTRLRDTLIHEVVGHALLEASGLSYWLRQKMQLGDDTKNEEWFEAQETFVRWHTPIVITTLRSMKMLSERKR